MPTRRIAIGIIALLLSPGAGWAAGAAEPASLVHTVYGYIGVVLFVAAYCLVPLENKIHLRKSKPVLAAGVIWVLMASPTSGWATPTRPMQAIKGNLLEYAELFLFLLVAMTYINSMEERNVFEACAPGW